MWKLEQDHSKSPYIYPELDNEGRGSPVGRTGMTWCGFRPSDDKPKFHYNVPVNMFVASALRRILIVNKRVWKDISIAAEALQLAGEIEEGIRNFGIVTIDNERVYAYEVHYYVSSTC